MLVLEPWTPCGVQTAAHEDHLPVGLKEPLPRCSEGLSPRRPSIWEPHHPSRSALPSLCAGSATLHPPWPLTRVRGISRRSRKKGA